MTPSTHRLIAVFREDEVDAALHALERAGVPRSSVRIGDTEGRQQSLRAEMRQELERTTVGPGNVGPFTKEMRRGVVGHMTIGAVVGAVVALPLALIPVGDLAAGWRLLLAALCGGAVGWAVGFTVGGATGARGPAEPMAAERGVAITVDSATAEAADVLRARGPIRIDLLTMDGAPVETIDQEDEGSLASEVGGATAKATMQKGGDWRSAEDRDRQPS